MNASTEYNTWKVHIMGIADTLLQLLADLQRDMSIQHGRRTLLAYAQACSGAKLALIFALDQMRQQLVLLEYGISYSSEADGRQEVETRLLESKSDLPDNHTHIPLHGLFGAVLSLSTHVFHYFAHPASDVRCLEEERYWFGEDGAVMLYALGEGQGLLVLCFDTAEDMQANTDHEENLYICATLLSAYLSTDEEDLPTSPLHKFIDSSMYVESNQHLPPTYEVRLQEAIDQERNRIARDIHDGAAQHIAHVLHKLEFAQHILPKQPEAALREINRSTLILKESLNDLRHGIASLIPVELEKQEFASALQALLDEHTHDTPFLNIRYEGDDLSLLPLSLEVVIFRFIQEALNNVRKHARATEVIVRIRLLAHLLAVSVSDNGRGFSVKRVMSAEQGDAAYAQHLGLRTMRERILQAGGNWEVQSRPGVGTRVKATFFLETPPVALTHREREVLQLLAGGLTNRAIAEKLSVSIETVKSHVRHIMQKMHVNDRTQAAVEATRQRLM